MDIPFERTAEVICRQLVSSDDDHDDFEIVPQDPDGDVDMWDVDGENEDEIKREKVQSTSA